MQKQGHCTYPLGLGETLYVLAYSQPPPGHILARSTPQNVKFLAPKTGQSYLVF